MQLVLHAPFGSRVNRAWGLALRKRFCRSFNFELQAAATEDAIVLSLGPQHRFALADVFQSLKPETVEQLLVQAMLDAPMFGSRWRWNATRALAVLRQRGGRKVPTPLQRMDAEDLIAAVFPDQIACPENLVATGRSPIIRSSTKRSRIACSRRWTSRASSACWRRWTPVASRSWRGTRPSRHPSRTRC